MQASTILIIFGLTGLTQARPHMPPNFMLWNYFPYLQQRQLQVMQQASMPMMQPVNMPHPMQYPTFEMIFNHAIPMANNMPIMGEVQFQMPVAQANPPATTTKAATTPRPHPTTTKKSTPPPAAWPTRPQASVKQSTPQVANVLKSQLSKGVFEMARHIQANILSEGSHQQTGKFNVFSPINVAAVLSLLELGAREQTQQELRHILGFDKLQPSECSRPLPLDRHYALGQMLESMAMTQGAQINMANGIFIQTGYSLRQDYRTSVETIYQSQVTSLDFQQQPSVATKFINDWVQLQTNGKIANILDGGIDKNTRMMVASAVHFKSLWMSSFIAEATSKRPFYPNGKAGQRIMVDTMVNGGEFMYYESKDYDCSIMALPFKDQTTAMYVILPKKSNEAKLRKLQTSLTADIVEDMISKMKLRTSLISLPKMHLSDTLDLKDVLSQLKVRNVFDSGSSDLSGISEHNHISLDGFVHKIDLTINEVGTEGAAATATSLSRHEPDVVFRVDSPFMFFVRHEATQLPIFYGSVIEPVNSS